MKFKAVLFDLDGTIADTIEDIKDSLNEMLRANGYPELSLESTINNICYGEREFIGRSLPGHAKDEENLARCAAEYSQCYTKRFVNRTVAYEGLAEILAALSAQGTRLAVVTNKGHEKSVVITHKLYGKSVFEKIIGVGGNVVPKPDPTTTLEMLKEFGVKPEEAAFVGDSDIDIKTARNAGLYAVGVLWGYRDRKCLEEAGADIIVSDRKELARVLLG